VHNAADLAATVIRQTIIHLENWYFCWWVIRIKITVLNLGLKNFRNFLKL
jgi:hypothetical protein